MPIRASLLAAVLTEVLTVVSDKQTALWAFAASSPR